MANATTVNTIETIRSALREFASNHGWAESDYVFLVDPGAWNDIHVRIGARAFDQGQSREALTREIWEFIRDRLPHHEFSRISLFGCDPLERFKMLYADYLQEN